MIDLNFQNKTQIKTLAILEIRKITMQYGDSNLAITFDASLQMTRDPDHSKALVETVFFKGVLKFRLERARPARPTDCAEPA